MQQLCLLIASVNTIIMCYFSVRPYNWTTANNALSGCECLLTCMENNIGKSIGLHQPVIQKCKCERAFSALLGCLPRLVACDELWVMRDNWLSEIPWIDRSQTNLSPVGLQLLELAILSSLGLHLLQFCWNTIRILFACFIQALARPWLCYYATWLFWLCSFMLYSYSDLKPILKMALTAVLLLI